VNEKKPNRAALLAGKLVEKIGLETSVEESVRTLVQDPDPRVAECAERAAPAFENRRGMLDELPEEERVILIHGHYEELESFKTAQIVYQGTVDEEDGDQTGGSGSGESRRVA